MYICVVGTTRNAEDMFVVIRVLVVLNAMFSPGLFFFFLIFAHLLWFGVLEFGSWVGLLRFRFQLMGFGGCGVGLLDFFLGLGLS